MACNAEHIKSNNAYISRAIWFQTRVSKFFGKIGLRYQSKHEQLCHTIKVKFQPWQTLYFYQTTFLFQTWRKYISDQANHFQLWLFYYKCYLLFKTKRHKLSHALLLTYYLFSFPVKFLTFLKSVFTSSSSISIFWIDAAVSQKNVHEIITTNIFRSAMQLRNMRTLRVYFEVTPKTEATFPKLGFEILCKGLL